MIIAMDKYSFLIHHRQYEDFMKNLGKLGVVHIIERPKENVAKLEEIRQRLTTLNRTVRFLQSRKQESRPSDDSVDALSLIREIADRQTEYDNLGQHLISLKKEISLMEPWGDFSRTMLERLKKEGVDVAFCQTSLKRFSEAWKEKYYLEEVNRRGSQIFFVIFYRDGEKPDLDAEDVRLPARSLNESLQEEETVKNRRTDIERYFNETAATRLSSLTDEIEHLTREEAYHEAIANTDRMMDGQLMVLQGWIPRKSTENLKHFCEEHDIVLIRLDVSPGDKIPILLKNNWFNKLFEPIGELFSLPAYQEMDATPLFAPFFALFFGLCLGDAGYGFMIFLLCLIARFLVGDKLRPFMALGIVLGLGTIFVGVATGTLFGMKMTDYSWAKEYILIKDIPVLSADQQMFYLALAIGFFQVLFGMAVNVVNMARQFGFIFGLASIGRILTILGTLSLVAISNGVIAQTFHLPMMIGLWAGLALLLFFNDPTKPIYIQFGLGLYQLYNLATGLFGDVLSYVRLFALGISSAILGLVINQIGFQFAAIPYVGPIIAVAFLVVGHTANILIASLGAFVHPMRLTFVEFYKNLGFMGGGKPYTPFSSSPRSAE